MTMETVSTPEAWTSLQHYISRLLPSSAHNILSRLTMNIYRITQHSFHSVRPSAETKDEIWHLLRSVSVCPSPSQLDEIFSLSTSIHEQFSKALKTRSFKDNDDRLFGWNNNSAAFFEQMVLTAGVGKRIHDPREADISFSESSTDRLTSSLASQSATTRYPSSSSHSKSSGFDPSWLRQRCSQLEIARSGEVQAHEMAMSVMLLLSDGSLSDEHLQGDLFDAFNGDFDAVADVLKHRPSIRANSDAIMADCSQAEELRVYETLSETSAPRPRGVRGRSGRPERAPPGQAMSAQLDDEFEEDEILLSRNFGGSAFEERQRAFPGVRMERDSVIGAVDKVGLPKGSTRKVEKGYEEIFVPPPEKRTVRESDLINITSALKQYPELLTAMKGVHTLNRLQSAVFPVAFESDENLLVCAPTGAGKTNVALLTIFREVVTVKSRMKRNFKVVYVAPMKALAAEVTEKFSQRLNPLGLVVKEFTGDMSLSRAEASATDVLVTTPEKWDVVTRKTGSEVGESVTLFIVDEIHLLHDERGAVLESIVARTLRFSETAQRQIRLVGLSATLPNYSDVGAFMRVNPEKGLFHFDGGHRPVPLSQTFIGITEGANSSSNEARRKKEAKMHELTWKQVKDSLQRGHQAMIFVHSRKGTSNAAREMLRRAAQDDLSDIFMGGTRKSVNIQSQLMDHNDENEDGAVVLPTWAAKEISKSKTADIRELCARGIGIHNAGLPRPDRKLVEKLFAEGVLRLLCCTATLAWGINLPARTVIIMGTEVYNAEKGGFVQLGILDVTQIFGRAGRPQFDTEGEGTIITDHEHLGKYLRLLTSSVPIESQLGASASRLADHLNAEIVSGTVSSVGDGVRWLSYTYLSVRMPQNPLVYGIDRSEVEADYGLHSRRANLIDQASKALDDARMCRYDPRTGILSPTDLGRVSSHFYVSHETVVLWNELLSDSSDGPVTCDRDRERISAKVIHAVSCATEFEQMRSREEEAEELEHLTRSACPIPLWPGYGSDTREGKVAILLQAHISRAQIRMSDLSYVVQSATRLLRALFEISLRRGLPGFSVAALELARASESRIWPYQHPLWQFTYLSRKERGFLISPETIAAIETSERDHDLATLRSLSREELSDVIRAPKIAQTVEKVLNFIPTLEIASAKVAPLSRTLLSFQVSLVATFTWNDLFHGNLESWWLWVEDKMEDRIYHSQKILLTKWQVRQLNLDRRQNVGENQKQTLDLRFTTAVFDPPSSEYWVRIESDRWHTGGGSSAILSVASMQLPEEISFKSDLTSVSPTRIASVLNATEAAWFENQFSHFNSAQTAVLHVTRFSNENVFISAPPGSGKFVMAELAMLRAFQKRASATVLFISLHEGILEKVEKSWERFCTFSRGQTIILHQERNSWPSPDTLGDFSIVLATPKIWNEFVQRGNEREILSTISLIVFHDMHRLSDPDNVEVEFLISRLRRHRRNAGTLVSSEKNYQIPRLLALSSVFANQLQVADWIGVSRKLGLFCFGQEARQVPCESHVISVAGDRYSSRMQSINRPLYSTINRYSSKKPVLVFVSSRRQTLLTARDLLRLASLDGKNDMFADTGITNSNISRQLRLLRDAGLRQVVPKGIALYHENMSSVEHEAVEQLLEKGYVQVVIATFKMASRISTRVHSVIVKGTEVYDVRTRRYEDVNISDIMYMMGQAGRTGTDNTCYGTVFVHEPKQTLFKKLLHEALPIESNLVFEKTHETILKEIAAGNVGKAEDLVDLLRNSFFFQRLCSNPGYYGLKKSGQRKLEKTGMSIRDFESKQRKEFSNDIVTRSLTQLEALGCITVSSYAKSGKFIEITPIGNTCCSNDICPETGQLLHKRLEDCVTFENAMDVLSCCAEIMDVGKEFEEHSDWDNVLGQVVSHYVNSKIYENDSIAAKEMKLRGWAESSQKRVKLMCYFLLINKKPPSNGLFQLDKLLYVVLKTASAGIDVANAFNSFEAVKQWTRITQCFAMRRVRTDNIWTLFDINAKGVVEQAQLQGWTTMNDVYNRMTDFSVYVAGALGEVERATIMRWVNAYPKLKLVNAQKNNNSLLVTVSVNRDRLAGSRLMFGEQDEGYVLALWDEQQGRLIGSKRTRILPESRENGHRRSVDINFELDAEADINTLKVWAASEEYVCAEIFASCVDFTS